MHIHIHVETPDIGTDTEVYYFANAVAYGDTPVRLTYPVQVSVAASTPADAINDEIVDTVKTALATEHGITFTSADEYVISGAAMRYVPSAP